MLHNAPILRVSLKSRARLVPGLLSLLFATTAVSAALAHPASQEPEAAATPPPAAVQDLPPVPDPPRFMSEVIGTIGDIAGDLFFWGQSGTLAGEVAHNAIMGAQMLTIDGKIRGDLFAFAATTTIDGEIFGDVYAFTSDLRITEDTVIHGNLLTFAGSLRIDGLVRGQVSGGGGTTSINGDVGRVSIECGSLRLGPNAIVRGDLDYESNEEAELAEGAVVQGELRREGTDEPADDGTEAAGEEASASGISFWDIGWKVWGYLAKLVVGVVFLVLGGRGSRLPAALLQDRPGSGLGFGFVVAVVMPVSCVVAVVLLVTLPLGVIGLMLFGLLVYLGSLVAAQFFGDWLLRRLAGQSAPSEYLALAIGLLALTLVALVPYVGFLVRLAAALLGIGGIYLALRQSGFPSLGGPPHSSYSSPQPDAA